MSLISVVKIYFKYYCLRKSECENNSEYFNFINIKAPRSFFSSRTIPLH